MGNIALLVQPHHPPGRDHLTEEKSNPIAGCRQTADIEFSRGLPVRVMVAALGATIGSIDHESRPDFGRRHVSIRFPNHRSHSLSPSLSYWPSHTGCVA